MTIERLEELKDLLIWMTGSSEISFRGDQAELFSDGLKLIEAEIARQSVNDESINMAIELLEHYLRLEYYRGYDPKENYASYDLAIDALRAYKPKEPCEWCSRLSIMATQDNTAVYPPTREKVVFNCCPNCGQNLKWED